MATEVNLPELGESVTEGTVTRWLKQVGDDVAVDEPLLEVSTDKVDTEIPSPIAGTLLEIKAQEDDTVEIGATLAVIGGADEAPDTAGDGGSEAGAGGQAQAAEEPEQPAPVEQQAEPEQAEPEPAEPEERQSEPEAPSAAAEGSDTPGPASSGGESTVVRLPELGESVTEGTVTRWLKQVGDEVAADEPLLEVSTDKVDTEIPSPVAGRLQEIKVNEDETVEVGTELAVIGSGEGAPAAAAPAGEAPAKEEPAQEAAPQEAPAQEAPAQEAPA
ncbi:MAG: biotin/lipoyl-containing protein, partial [Nocardioides sp.]